MTRGRNPEMLDWMPQCNRALDRGAGQVLEEPERSVVTFVGQQLVVVEYYRWRRELGLQLMSIDSRSLSRHMSNPS